MTDSNDITRPLPPFLTQEVIDDLTYLLDIANDYRETLLELYHVYILHEHNALPLNFSEMAHHVRMLSDLLKTLGQLAQTQRLRAGQHT